MPWVAGETNEKARALRSRSAHAVARLPDSVVPTKVAEVVATHVGASFTGVTLILNVWVALVSEPPFTVVPLSWRLTPMVADPLAFGASV